MGEGTKYATTSGDVRMKFIEQINYQEIDEGEVSFLFMVLPNLACCYEMEIKIKKIYLTQFYL